MNRALLPLRRYAEFHGRSRRSEYWLFTLLVTLVSFVVLLGMMFHFARAAQVPPGLDQVKMDQMGAQVSMGFFGWVALFGLLYLAILVPSIAVQVRRFHDQDRSGWLVLLNFVPYVGCLIVLIFMCIDGTQGANRYGPDPKADLFETF